jgi:hypothetical protein
MLSSVNTASNVVILLYENLQCLRRQVEPQSSRVDDHWRIVNVDGIDYVVLSINLEIAENNCRN